MGAAAAVLMVAGAMWSAYSQHEAGKEIQHQKEMEAHASEKQAALTRMKAQMLAADKMEETRKLLGTQRARLAAAGVHISSGSPLALQVSTRVKGEKDAQRILWLGEQEANVHEYNAELLYSEGEMYRSQYTRAAFGTLLGGGSNSALAYQSSQQSG